MKLENIRKLAGIKEGEKLTIEEVTYTLVNGSLYKYVDDNSGYFINHMVFETPIPKGTIKLGQRETKELISKLGTDETTSKYLYGTTKELGGDLPTQISKGIAREIKVKGVVRKDSPYTAEQLKNMKPSVYDFNKYVDIVIVSDSKPSKKLVPVK